MQNITVYTIGYGGRRPEEFLDLLAQNSIKAVIDVRLEPNRSSMGCYRLAKTSDKGIQRLLASWGIAYLSFRQLGNEFRHEADWPERYRAKLAEVGDKLIEPLLSPDIPRPFCLMCSERKTAICHRGLIAAYLEGKGFEVKHIE